MAVVLAALFHHRHPVGSLYFVRVSIPVPSINHHFYHHYQHYNYPPVSSCTSLNLHSNSHSRSSSNCINSSSNSSRAAVIRGYTASTLKIRSDTFSRGPVRAVGGVHQHLHQQYSYRYTHAILAVADFKKSASGSGLQPKKIQQKQQYKEDKDKHNKEMKQNQEKHQNQDQNQDHRRITKIKTSSSSNTKRNVVQVDVDKPKRLFIALSLPSQLKDLIQDTMDAMDLCIQSTWKSSTSTTNTTITTTIGDDHTSAFHVDVSSMQHSASPARDGFPIRYVSKNHTHITLEFIGDTESAHIRALQGQLERMVREQEVLMVECQLARIMAHPVKSPRLVWIPIIHHQEDEHDTGARYGALRTCKLKTLAAKTIDAVDRWRDQIHMGEGEREEVQGNGNETTNDNKRKRGKNKVNQSSFSPHITVARERGRSNAWKNNKELLNAAIENTVTNLQYSYHRFTVSSLELYESTLSPEGSIYTLLSTHAFGSSP